MADNDAWKNIDPRLLYNNFVLGNEVSGSKDVTADKEHMVISDSDKPDALPDKTATNRTKFEVTAAYRQTLDLGENSFESASAHQRRCDFRACITMSEHDTDRLSTTNTGSSRVKTGSPLSTSQDSFRRRVQGSGGPRNRTLTKKPTINFDEVDELMISMREAGYTDRHIQKKLKEKGIEYELKSVGTRIQRLRIQQSKTHDWELKEGYKEWSMEDDLSLVRAFDLADLEIRFEAERLRALRFRKVADWMHRFDKDIKYSSEACRDRYYALANGTARIPSDQDDDPAARKAEMARFCKEREIIRENERMQEENEKDDKKKEKEDVLTKRAKKATEAIKKRQEKERSKAARATEMAAKANIRLAQEEEKERKRQACLERLEKKKRAREEKVKIREEERKARKLTQSDGDGEANTSV